MTKTLRVNGIEVDFEECGSGEPLLLLHGGETDRRQFDVFLPLLGDDIRAIAYDQRDSVERPYEGDYDMAVHADDCASFIEALGYERVHLMGTSYGGTVAMTTAIRHPERVKSLILGATTPAYSMVTRSAPESLRSMTPDETARFMLAALITPEAIDNEPQLVLEARAAIGVRPLEANARRMAVVSAHDVRAQLQTISSPTLVIHGDEDPLVPLATAEWMAGTIPNAQFRVLQGCRHGITLQHRTRTAHVVRSFVLAHAGAEIG